MRFAPARAFLRGGCGVCRAAIAIALLAVTIVVVPPAMGLTSPDTASPCLGAASRDRDRPCVNPSLRFEVTPAPTDAIITPDAPCMRPAPDNWIFRILRHRHDGVFRVCLFGAEPPDARYGVALVGDSHAAAWRAALAVAASSLHWEGSSMTRSSCPFSAAAPLLGEALTAQCFQWRRSVAAWFKANPHVGTVFVAAHAPALVVRAPGKSMFETEVAGYVGAWRALPRSVRHIVVLRDTPYVGTSTGPCVQAAMERHQRAGTVCAVGRSAALLADPAVVAARQFGPRASVIDMTRFFCDKRLCYPVIGGVLVYKDYGHITRLYSETLGRYLLHKLGKLLVSWG